MKFLNIILNLIKRFWNASYFNFDSFILTIVVFAIIKYFTVYQNLDFLNPFINTMEDFNPSDLVFSQIRNDGRYGLDTNVVLVNIGYLPRNGIAKQIEIINEYEPKAIGIDSFFRALRDESVDEQLRNAFMMTDKLVLASKIHFSYSKGDFDSVSYSNNYFLENAETGFANIIEELAGKTYKEMSLEEIQEKNEKFIKSVRYIMPKSEIEGNQHLFLGVKLAQQLAPEKVERFLNRNNEIEIVNFTRNTDKYITFDVKDIFERHPDLERIKGKIVLMGFLGPDLNTLVNEDIFHTPLNPQLLGKTFPDMYGVVIHANVISMIMNESYFYTLPEWTPDVLVLLILFATVNVLLFFRKRYEFAYEPLSIAFAFGSLFFWYSFAVFSFHFLYVQIDLGHLLYVILMIVPAFEAYVDSIKPLGVRYISSLYRKFTLIRAVRNSIKSNNNLSKQSEDVDETA